MPELPPLPHQAAQDSEVAPVRATEVQFDCTGCGSFVSYAPGTTSLVCGHCGRRHPMEPLGEGESVVRELDFEAALAGMTSDEATQRVDGGHEFRCEDCGARSVLRDLAGHCPYCDSPVVVEVHSGPDYLAPDALLPFAVPAEEAEDAFRSWVAGLWFAPNDLGRRAAAAEIRGVYLPYWTYDSRTTNTYSGQRGDHYWETERYTDSDGKQRTRQVQKTRWTACSGVVSVTFDDILVCASETLPRPLVEELEPWDLGRLEAHRPEYLSGFVAERYGIGLEEGLGLAEKRMLPVVRRAVAGDIGGDEQRIHALELHHDDVSFKHCLLPLWLSSFRYRRRVYRFVVNARTGEVHGERPYSVVKISLAVLALALGVAVIVWLWPLLES